MNSNHSAPSKKIGILPNPQKDSEDDKKCPKSQKPIKKSTKTLKVLAICQKEEPFAAQPFFKFHTAKEVFV
jgi:hypothetical protein